MTGAGPVPAGVLNQAELLRNATGHEPEITALGGHRWRLTMRNARVAMTIDFKAYSHGRRQWNGSTLTVDGQPRPLADNLADFTRIFLDPDSVKPDRRVEPEPPLPSCDIESAPAFIQHGYQMHAGHGYPIVVGYDGHRWALDITAGDAWIRFTCIRVNDKVMRDGFRVIVAGVDRTREARGSEEQAMALFLRGRTAAAAPPDATGRAQHTAPSRGRDSAAVRRDSVIRT